MSDDSTIVLRATPPGEGGIHSVWVIGPQARNFLEKAFRGKILDTGISLGQIHWNREIVDDAMLCKLDSGALHGLTGFELFVHGSMAVVEKTLDLFEELGAVRRNSTESIRNVWRNSASPSVCEALDLLVQARTREAAAFFLAQSKGLLDDWKRQTEQFEKSGDVREVKERIQSLLKTAEWGLALGAPKQIAIAGRPNAGKSSLFNAWLGFERVIVSQVEGTTRDPVRERASLGGYPIELIDTAGLRATDDELEGLSGDRARSALSAADFLIWVHDGSRGMESSDLTFLRSYPKAKLLFLNKGDLTEHSKLAQQVQDFSCFRGSVNLDPNGAIAGLSAEAMRLMQLPRAIPLGAALFTRRQQELLLRHPEKFIEL